MNSSLSAFYKYLAKYVLQDDNQIKSEMRTEVRAEVRSCRRAEVDNLTLNYVIKCN